MRAFPLLDLESAWKDAQQILAEIKAMADTLLAESEETWRDMTSVAGQAEAALKALGALPEAVQKGIAGDAAAFHEMESRADAASY